MHDHRSLLHHPPVRRFLSGALALTLSAFASSQAPTEIPSLEGEPDASELTRIAAGARGIQMRKGRPIGLGAGYRANFEKGRVDFLPALGERAAESRPVGFQLETIRVGETVVHKADDSTSAAIDGDFVRYQRGPAIVEQYEVRTDGILQSFVFHDLPSAQGDLVVRGELTTKLAHSFYTADGGLNLEDPELGGVHFGGVTGISADGRTVAGTLRYEQGALELSLPADFVQSAELPLVLDPLITPVITVNDSAFNDLNPSVCRALSYYYVVWQRTYSATHSDILLQRVTTAGSLEGAIYVIADEYANTHPSIGWVKASGRLLIAFSRSFSTIPPTPKVYCASYRTNNHDVSEPLFLHPGPVALADYARVGGDESGSDDEAMVVWEEQGVGVRMRLVTVPPEGDPVHAGPIEEVDESTGNYKAIRPDISESVDEDGDFLLVWERQFYSNGHGQIFGRAYTRNGDPIGTEVTYLSSEVVGSRSCHYPSCDGDGKNFLVAYERAEGLMSVDSDIACKPVTVRSSGIETSFVPKTIANDSGISESRPCVSVTGSGAVVGWLELGWWLDGAIFGAYSLFYTNVDLYTGNHYGDMDVAYSAEQITSYDICAQASGRTSTLRGGLIAWDTSVFMSGNADIRATRFESPGAVYSSGGDCGGGGLHKIMSAGAGNGTFAIHLRDSTPGSLAVLVIGESLFPIDCGPCTLWPSLESVYYANTNGDGDAKVTIPLGPELAGLTFHSQWAVFSPGGACTLVDLNLTRSLTTTIEGAP